MVQNLIFLDNDLNNKLKVYASMKSMSKNDCIIYILKEYLDNNLDYKSLELQSGNSQSSISELNIESEEKTK